MVSDIVLVQHVREVLPCQSTACKQQLQRFALNLLARAAAKLSFVILGIVVLVSGAQAQTFSVLHSFMNENDGAVPEAGVTIDQFGNLYGTTANGGTGCQCGVVYKLAQRNGSWILTPLYEFGGGNDGSIPTARVVFGPDGKLYGTTQSGGASGIWGTVFSLVPPATVCKTAFCPWKKTTLYSFSQDDGAYPNNGDLVFDRSGNIYGVTNEGGPGDCREFGCGAVYKLSQSNGQWSESALYLFQTNTGNQPWSGVLLDSSGNAYGTTPAGGPNNTGTIYQLTPSGDTWSEMDIYDFPNPSNGSVPEGGLIADSSGNLYGTATGGSPGGAAAVFELTPSGGSWNYQVIYTSANFAGSWANLSIDAAGNLYGTTYQGGAHESGAVFTLTHTGNGWSYSSLHDFTGGTDGRYPVSNVAMDASGNLYGTAEPGGTPSQPCPQGCGVVWKITP